MSMVCQDCDSTDIGYNALVDRDGGLVRIYDDSECLECGSTNIVEERDI